MTFVRQQCEGLLLLLVCRVAQTSFVVQRWFLFPASATPTSSVTNQSCNEKPACDTSAGKIAFPGFCPYGSVLSTAHDP